MKLVEQLHKGQVYGITDPAFLEKGSKAQVRALMESGITWIQYRRKTATLDEKRRELEEIYQLQGIQQVTLIINDDLELAKEFPVQGLHLGQDDLHPVKAREVLGKEKLIGLSTHNPEQVIEAKNMAVDYIGVGPCFPSTTKPDAQEGGLDFLKWAKQNSNLPIVAIGGIDEGNLSEIVKRGVKTAAIISDLAKEKNRAAKVARLQQILRS